MTKSIRVTALAVAGLMMLAPIHAQEARADECAADVVEIGAKQFRKCKVCHKLEDGKNGVGPHLFQIVGRGIADVDGYNYSGAMKDYGADDAKVWDAAELHAYLEAPKKHVKGTKMAFSGIRKEDARQALICYLEKEAGSPPS